MRNKRTTTPAHTAANDLRNAPADAPAQPARAVAYTRISTDDQTTDPQRDAIAAWAQRAGVEIVAWFADVGVSGGAAIDACPGLADALSAVAAHPGAVLLVARRDRVARDVVKAAVIESTLARTGGRIVSVAGEGDSDDPGGLLMRRIVDAFAEYERALIRARTKAALQAKKRRGERVGGVPYGFRARGGVLETDAHEIRAVEIARARRVEGATLETIGAELETFGLVTRSGRRFNATQVRRMVLRETPSING
jgi:DNA invertase Pin-like site-specific DNA recombinase